MTHPLDTKYQEHYELTVNSTKGDYPKGYILNRGLIKLGFSLDDISTFNYTTLKDSWVSNNAIPTEEEIKTAAIAQIETDISMQYQGNRANAYPQYGEQLDLLWHAIDADADLKTKLADFYNAIKTVKDANPKP